MDGADPFRASLPIRHRRAGQALELRVSMAFDTMEHASERVTILARLLDTHSIADIGRDLEEAQSHESAQRTTTS